MGYDVFWAVLGVLMVVVVVFAILIARDPASVEELRRAAAERRAQPRRRGFWDFSPAIFLGCGFFTLLAYVLGDPRVRDAGFIAVFVLVVVWPLLRAVLRFGRTTSRRPSSDSRGSR
jgi:hypothetical protein